MGSRRCCRCKGEKCECGTCEWCEGCLACCYGLEYPAAIGSSRTVHQDPENLCRFFTIGTESSLEFTETELIAVWDDAGTLRTFRGPVPETCTFLFVDLPQDGGGDDIRVSATAINACYSVDEWCLNFNISGITVPAECGYPGPLCNGDLLRAGRMWDFYFGGDSAYVASLCTVGGRETDMGRIYRLYTDWTYTSATGTYNYTVSITYLTGPSYWDNTFIRILYQSPEFEATVDWDGDALKLFEDMYLAGELPAAEYVSHEGNGYWQIDPTQSKVYCWFTRAPIDDWIECLGVDCNVDPLFNTWPCIEEWLSPNSYLRVLWATWPDEATLNGTGWTWSAGEPAYCPDMSVEYILTAEILPRDEHPSFGFQAGWLHYVSAWEQKASIGSPARDVYCRFESSIGLFNAEPKIVGASYKVYQVTAGSGPPLSDNSNVITSDCLAKWEIENQTFEYCNPMGEPEGIMKAYHWAGTFTMGQPWPWECNGITQPGYEMDVCYYDGNTGDGNIIVDYGVPP